MMKALKYLLILLFTLLVKYQNLGTIIAAAPAPNIFFPCTYTRV